MPLALLKLGEECVATRLKLLLLGSFTRLIELFKIIEMGC